MTVSHLTLICPHCGKRNNCHESFDHPDMKPDPGSYMLCIGCGGFAVYTHDDSLRLPTADELAEINADPDAQRHRDAWEWMNRQRIRLKRVAKR